MTSKFKNALKEATIDTSIALPLNLLINWIVITFAFSYNWTALQTTILATIIFTSMAILRKTYIRLHFEKKHASQ